MINKFETSGRYGIVDAGGRGHTIADAMAQNTAVKELVVVPGNDYIKHDIEKVYPDVTVTLHKNVGLTDSDAIVDVFKNGEFDLVDVAQDDAIAGNVAGRLRDLGLLVVGPNRDAGRIEWDKAYFRDLNIVPQPGYGVVENENDLEALLDNMPDAPYYVKAAYLAAGKGAVPAENKDQVREVYKELRKRDEKATKKVVIEEWMRNADGTPGDEFSQFIFTDGKDYVVAGNAADYKRVDDFDLGDNTGSMGSNSPTSLMTPEIARQTHDSVVEPLMEGIQRHGLDYQGIIYVSGIVTKDKGGRPLVRVVETNARWGDSEAEVVIPGIKNFNELNMAVATRTLNGMKVDSDNRYRVAVAGVARGYPGNYKDATGKAIYGLENANAEHVHVMGAGMEKTENGWKTKGGRLFYPVGDGETLDDARASAYASMSRISVEGDNLHYRKGIGMRDVLRNQASKDA